MYYLIDELSGSDKRCSNVTKGIHHCLDLGGVACFALLSYIFLGTHENNNKLTRSPLDDVILSVPITVQSVCKKCRKGQTRDRMDGARSDILLGR